MEGIPPGERLHLQSILELDAEQLEVEEVDSDEAPSFNDNDDESSSLDGHGDGGGGRNGGFTFDISLASTHSYLGEVDDIHCRRSFWDGGATLTLPMFYLEGIVLFPEATLPLRVIQPRFKAAVELAMKQEEAPGTIGVIHVRANPRGEGLHFSVVGTTAEIRQLRHLEDGSINVVTRGRQRFCTSHAWINADGVPCAQVQIIPEDIPLHIPRDAFGTLASIQNHESGKVPKAAQNSFGMRDAERESGMDELECEDDYPSVFSNHPEACTSTGSHSQSASVDDGSASEDDETSPRWWWSSRRDRRNWSSQSRQAERVDNSDGARILSGGSDCSASESTFQEEPCRQSVEADWGGACKAWASDESKWLLRPPRTSWPHWVYRMFDAYNLARRAADMWRQMVELPSLNDLVQKPEILSYYIASKIPVQDATRQELLESDGVVSRLRREIQLLESMDCIRCKTCKNVVARRSDMLVMSSDGPLGVYVNNAGYVHETLTLAKVRGLILQGRPETMHSWFPGYSWTVADCNLCESHMGWLFRALKDLHPRQFWGLRRSQLAEKAS
ncbi:hypothetical protein GOP47_0027781 [Adiantum capillus-veneris]|nr:hypothetical protein GOP47_0027781 [Adiantum capillus-veneris]